jgi:hypothetical protein
MDNTLFEEILNEIDSMSSEEYWNLYQNAQKLSAFDPPRDLYWEPVSFPANWSDVVTMPISTLPSSVYHTSASEFETRKMEMDDYSNREDILCPQAA